MQPTETTQRARPKLPTWILALVVPVIAVVAVLATGPTWSAPAASREGSSIRIQDFAFSPDELHVAPGTKVAVFNADSTTHTMSATTGKFDTSNLRAGKRATIVAPTTPGRYRFVCHIHPTMVGTLVVSGR